MIIRLIKVYIYKIEIFTEHNNMNKTRSITKSMLFSYQKITVIRYVMMIRLIKVYILTSDVSVCFK